MSVKAKLIIGMVVLIAVLLSACTGIPDSQVDINTLQGRLRQIDTYKKTVPDIQESQHAYNKSNATFRGIKFGSSMEMVSMIETLPLIEEYTDALDYTGSGLYGYEMLLTYWFNLDDQLYRVAYSMDNDRFFETVDSLAAALQGDYGEPHTAGYYDYENAEIIFETEEEPLQAIGTQSAYYYEAFVDDNGTQIELFAEKTDDSYGYWVCYTDYSYYNG